MRVRMHMLQAIFTPYMRAKCSRCLRQKFLQTRLQRDGPQLASRLGKKTTPSATGGGETSYPRASHTFVRPIPVPILSALIFVLLTATQCVPVTCNYPADLPEVEHPPDTFTGSHAETPHMLRLRSAYIQANPQVWRTSETDADATREDVEGFYADWLTRPD